jgi:transcriptional regulator with XRE-family HTH domain
MRSALPLKRTFGQLWIRPSAPQRVLSMRELQELSGVSHNTIWRIESGRQGAHPRTIRTLAEALGAEPEELLKKEE